MKNKVPKTKDEKTLKRKVFAVKGIQRIPGKDNPTDQKALGGRGS